MQELMAFLLSTLEGVRPALCSLNDVITEGRILTYSFSVPSLLFPILVLIYICICIYCTVNFAIYGTYLVSPVYS